MMGGAQGNAGVWGGGTWVCCRARERRTMTMAPMVVENRSQWRGSAVGVATGVGEGEGGYSGVLW